MAAMVPQIGLVEEGFNQCLALSLVGNALQHGHMVEHIHRGDARINAEILRQIAKPFPQLLRLGKYIEIAEPDRAIGGGLQRRDGAHQSRFASAIWPKQPVHSARDRQIHIIKRACSVCIDMADTGDFEHDLPSCIARL